MKSRNGTYGDKIEHNGVLEHICRYHALVFWLSHHPISLSELASELEISKSTAHRIVTALVKELYFLEMATTV
ncbi:MAG: hypothetical protein DRP08_01930 [Candidatus Aenigmatarchaeota archaeon]|nr:MAG: hypothetical protein DRP08_01930 [Candidatus Aenigmarchaeota archaeon]